MKPVPSIHTAFQSLSNHHNPHEVASLENLADKALGAAATELIAANANINAIANVKSNIPFFISTLPGSLIHELLFPAKVYDHRLVRPDVLIRSTSFLIKSNRSGQLAD
jgi:hypothetical protein